MSGLMKKIVLPVAVCLMLFSCMDSDKNQPESISKTSEPAKMRVISNLPNITQIMFAAGIDDLLVGITDFCEPADGREITRIGGIMNPDFERIIALKPDLIIVQDTLKELERKYNELGFKTLETRVHSIDDILYSINLIGEATHEKTKTDKLVKKLEKEFDDLRNFAKGKKPVNTLLVIGNDQNTLREIWAAGGNTLYNEVLKLAGGKNILESSVMDYPVISKEEILKKSPDAILILTGKSMTQSEIDREIKKWDVLSYVTAVKNKRVYVIPGKEAHIPGLDTPKIIRLIQKALFDNSKP